MTGFAKYHEGEIVILFVSIAYQGQVSIGSVGSVAFRRYSILLIILIILIIN